MNKKELSKINHKTCIKCNNILYITKDNIHRNNTINDSHLYFECQNCGKIYRIIIKDFTAEEIK